MADSTEETKSPMMEIEILHPIDHGTGAGYMHYDRGVHTLPRPLAEYFLTLTSRAATSTVENAGTPTERTIQKWGETPICRIYQGPPPAVRGKSTVVELKASKSGT